MIHISLLDQFQTHRRIGQSIAHLTHPNAVVRSEAMELLKEAHPACLPQLRRAAFLNRTGVAVTAAKLLYDMGDKHGLYALLAQEYSTQTYLWYRKEIHRALEQIGQRMLLVVLEDSLNEIVMSPWERALWITRAVHALHALKTLFTPHLRRFPLPRLLFQRAMTLYTAMDENLDTCRQAMSPRWSGSVLFPTLAQVRRSAIDLLLMLDSELAFELLTEALNHKEMQVRLTAIYGLTQLQDSRALLLLQPIAANRRHPLTKDARRAIEAFGTELADVLTLVRASQPTASSAELLRPASNAADNEPETLLRSTSANSENAL